MKTTFVSVITLLMAIMFTASCDQGSANNANKPANANTNTNSSNTAATSASSEADVKKFLSDLSAAISKNDAVALDKLYSDDYMFVGPDGVVQTKAQRLDAIRSGAAKYDSISFDDLKVHVYGDTATVIGTVTQKGTVNGKDSSGTSSVSIVLVKGKDGVWRDVLGHPSAPMAANKPMTYTNSNANTGSKGNTNTNK